MSYCALRKYELPDNVRGKRNQQRGWVIQNIWQAGVVSDDMLHMAIQREESKTTAIVVPIVVIEGAKFKPTGHDTYLAVIPQTVTPGSCLIILGSVDLKGLWSSRRCCDY